jgi:hypothetical protein
MKFLLGLIIGGVLTVLAAERFAFNGPDRSSSTPHAWLTWIETAAGRLEPGWAASGDEPFVLPAPPGPAAGDEETATAGIGAVSGATPGADPVADPGEFADEPPAADTQEPMVQLAGPEPLPPAEGPEPLLPAEGVDSAADLLAEPVSEAVQQVWAPFRSQTSAEGFARRLSSETEHPFGIDRRGPGRYQVFFAYADEDERRRLLERVRPLIGTAAP